MILLRFYMHAKKEGKNRTETSFKRTFSIMTVPFVVKYPTVNVQKKG